MANITLRFLPPDLNIICTIFSVMIVSLGLSYWVGAHIWRERHSITINFRGKPTLISGFWGEATIALLAGCVFLIVDLVTPAATLTRLLRDYHEYIGIFVGVCVILYFLYARSVVRNCIRTEAHRGRKHWLRLLATYVTYAPYAILLYISIISATVMLYLEYLIESSHLADQRAQILQHLHSIAAIRDPEKVQSAIEFTYGNILSIGNLVASSMSPVFAIIAIITAVIIFVTRSPLRHVLLVGSRNLAQYIAIIALALIFILTTVTYYFSYAELSSQSLAAIIAMRPSLLSGRWEILERFNEIISDLERRRSFLGFAGMVVNESGVSVIGVMLLQWVLGNLKFPKHSVQQERGESA